MPKLHTCGGRFLLVNTRMGKELCICSRCYAYAQWGKIIPTGSNSTLNVIALAQGKLRSPKNDAK